MPSMTTWTLDTLPGTSSPNPIVHLRNHWRICPSVRFPERRTSSLSKIAHKNPKHPTDLTTMTQPPAPHLFYRLWAAVIVLLGLLAWVGQSIVFLFPVFAAKVGLAEYEADVDPGLWADVVGESFCDMLVIWTMVVTGVLLWKQHYCWPYFGLVAGGTYVYFGVRGISQRVSVLHRGISYGTPDYIIFAMGLCAIWAIAALITISMAVQELERSRQRGQYETIV